MFKDEFQRIFDEEFKDQFDAAGLTYEHRLIDDMVAQALKWEGGYVWACKNYDGDVQSDIIAQGFGSLGLMTSVLMTADGKTVEAEAWHGHRHFRQPGRQADVDQPDRVDLRVDARPGAPRQARQHPEVAGFAETLEEVVISTVEGGQMTKDLAMLIGPSRATRPARSISARSPTTSRRRLASRRIASAWRSGPRSRRSGRQSGRAPRTLVCAQPRQAWCSACRR